MMVTTFCGQRINRANAEYAKPYVDRIKLNKAFTGMRRDTFYHVQRKSGDKLTCILLYLGGKQRYSGAHEWYVYQWANG